MRKRWTIGFGGCAKSSFGSPLAVMVLVSASRNTLLLPMVKMLASSCVTTTTVAPKLSRSSRIKSSSKRELIGSRPAEGSSKKSISGIQGHGTGQAGALLHAAADLGRIVVFETFQSDQGKLQRCDLADFVRI